MGKLFKEQITLETYNIISDLIEYRRKANSMMLDSIGKQYSSTKFALDNMLMFRAGRRAGHTTAIVDYIKNHPNTTFWVVADRNHTNTMRVKEMLRGCKNYEVKNINRRVDTKITDFPDVIIILGESLTEPNSMDRVVEYLYISKTNAPYCEIESIIIQIG